MTIKRMPYILNAIYFNGRNIKNIPTCVGHKDLIYSNNGIVIGKRWKDKYFILGQTIDYIICIRNRRDVYTTEITKDQKCERKQIVIKRMKGW